MSEVETPQVEPVADEAVVERHEGAPIESRFLYVDVSALRAKQLRRGARPRLEHGEDTATVKAVKAERVAMEEVRQNLVEWHLPEFKAVVDIR